jgi:hypothetical protein
MRLYLEKRTAVEPHLFVLLISGKVSGRLLSDAPEINGRAV